MEANGSSLQSMNKEDLAIRTKTLEARYIQLLEARIKALEATLGADAPKTKTEGNEDDTVSPIAKRRTNTLTNGDAKAEGSKDEDKTSADAPGRSNKRIKFIDVKYDDEGLQQEHDVVAIEKSAPEKRLDLAFTYRKYLDENGKYDCVIITMEDQNLRALLCYALSHEYEFETLEPTKAFELRSRFTAILRNWQKLMDIADMNEESMAFKEFQDIVRQVHSDRNKGWGPHKETLNLFLDKETLGRATKDLRALLDQVRATPHIEDYFTEIRDMQKNGSTTFEWLTTLFHCGELVYSRQTIAGSKHDEMFLVRSGYDWADHPTSKSSDEWTLDCWAYDWDGHRFNRVWYRCPIQRFEGQKDVRELPLYPLKFYKKDEKGVQDLKDDLVRRGKLFKQYCLSKKGEQMFEYHGTALTRGTGIRNTGSQYDSYTSFLNSKDDDQSKLITMNGDRVMIDFESYQLYNPISDGYAPIADLELGSEDYYYDIRENDLFKTTQRTHYDDDDGKNDWEDERYLICAPRLLGYHLTTKSWVELSVDSIRAISNKRDDTAFEFLQMPTVKKKLIKDLVQSHASREQRNSMMKDVVKGKGDGLVILLHGPPGVGKTLTAESVAQCTGKPLYSISVTDTGTDPVKVESRLKILFELGAAWQAVMLFDEADVFLETRTSNTASLDRNALVSVLLRVLEYYDGILILTTNRIKSIDVAVQSRINFGIRYRDLDDQQKRKIYLNFINQLNEDTTDDIQELREFGKDADQDESPFHKLNGRQIRNVLMSAASLARGEAKGEGGKLTLNHIKRVLKETQTFHQEVQEHFALARQKAEVGYEK